MKIKKSIYTVCISLFIFLILSSCEKEDSYIDPVIKGAYVRQIFSKNGETMPYRILFPEKFDIKQKYPILFFLHGAGEIGNDNNSQLTHGSSLFKDSLSKYPSIIVFPQCKKNDWWANNQNDSLAFHGFTPTTYQSLEANNTSVKLLEYLIDSLTKTSNIDKNRIYIMGISMGGMGAAQLLAKNPDLFASGVIIAGLAPLNYFDNLSQTPTWIFHGAKDEIVFPSHAVNYFESIEKGEKKHQLTIYQDSGHASWFSAFTEPNLLNWIFSKSK